MSTTDTKAATAIGRRFALELDGAEERLAEAKADFIDGMTQGTVSYAVRTRAADLINLEARAAIATQYLPSDKSPEDYDLDKAAAAFMEQTEFRLTSLQRGESGSTSGATRLVEAVEAEAHIRLYSRLAEARRYGDGQEG
jgi:hypothetical protein